MTWSPEQYTKFEDERNRPTYDLLARIPSTIAASAADIGCGPGNSTEILRARFPNALITAIDSSPEMIDAARKRLPDVQFDVADVVNWQQKGPFDVILANAVLQWVPDHASVLAALLAKLSPGGRLAVQIPDNLDEPAHCLMRELAENGPWSAKLSGASASRAVRQSADWYYRTLRASAKTVDIWRTTYHHLLPGGAAAVTEWFKSTGLRPFLDPLNEAERASFLSRYQAAVADAYAPLPDGAVLLPFPRLFFIASR